MEWIKTGHKQRRYNLYISKCGKYFKKTCSVSSMSQKVFNMLKTEARALQLIQHDNLPKIQRCVDVRINDVDGYIVSEYAGLNITYKTVPKDYDEQLKIIDSSLKLMVDKYKLYHNDVLPRNCFVLNSALTLIDFDLSTVGRPSRRTKERPQFNTCQLIREKINNRWKIK